MSKLEGKKILVTGASSGFGREIALRCAHEGADVALVARREHLLQEVADSIQQIGKRAVICAADVAIEEEIGASVSKAMKELGHIDILVNNAGMNVSERSIRDTSSEQWSRLLAVNLTSAYIFTKAVLPDMIERKQGTIINLASRAALYPDLAGGVAYSTSKMGMDALTQVTNEEGNPHNVRACLLCPGSANTPIVDRRPSPPSSEERMKLLQPEDVAEAVVFASSLPPRATVDLISMKPTFH